MQIDYDIAQIHQNIYDKIQLYEDLGKQKQEAKLLTNFLKTVKMYLYSNPKFYKNADSVGSDALKQYLSNQTAKQFAEEILKESFGKKLFAAEGTQHTFEEAFSLMQNLAYSAVENVKMDNSALFRGGQEKAGIGGNTNAKGSTYINLKDLPDDIARLSLKQLQKYFGENYKTKDQKFIYFNRVDQKIDNTALKLEINFNATLSPYARRIYTLLLTRNFSLKNYYSAGVRGLDKEKLEIGDTTFFRSIVSALQYSGLSYEDALKTFYRGISAIEYHQDSEVIEHFNHLKTIYEFTGAGQKMYSGDGEWVDMHTVDFLVYNDPSSTEIQVISVKEILQNALEEVNKSTLIKNVNYVVNRGKNRSYWKTRKKI